MIERLLHATVYPHPVRELTLHETHISWVILTGEFAYKIKKPVDFGFVDFSSIDKRKRYCELEFTLNSAFCPELYLDVTAVVELADGTLSLGSGDGVTVDHAVKMRQFDQHALFSDMASRGVLEVRHVDALAERIAGIHADAVGAESGTDHGSPEQIEYWSEENLDQIARRAGGERMVERIDALALDVHARHAALAEVFRMRRQRGFIRDCHGDLHLGNILWLNGTAQVFDRIEFNDQLRWIDVINDIAFTAMDLFHQRREDLAWSFINRYLRDTGDYQGAVLLPFYMSYRALVRAKIALLESANGTAPSAGFLSHLSLAEEILRPSDPALVVTCGLSGSGKTTRALQRVRETGGIVVQSDVERKRMAGLAARQASGDSLNSGIYSAGMNRKVYDHLLALADTLLDAGFTVVVDAAFLRFADRQRFRRLARERSVEFGILYCDATPDQLRDRIAARLREGSESEATLAVLENQLATAELPDASELSNRLGDRPVS